MPGLRISRIKRSSTGEEGEDRKKARYNGLARFKIRRIDWVGQ
jgi:hypothetical protein